MTRKLASVQIIKNFEIIPSSDFLYKAQVMGWSVVVRKSDFPKTNEEQKCVFFEIDSILPDGPEWSEFMRSKKFRVKTCKLRGVLSQGLAMPMSILGGKPNPNRRFWDWLRRKDGWRVGDDATSFLKVEKHGGPQAGKTPGFKVGQKAGNFPSFIPKTDEIRIQSAMHLLDRIEKQDIYVTVKCDGTSATYYKLNNEFGVCSRNRKVKPGDNVYWEIAERYMLDGVIPEGFAVQGEICGPRIQKNRLRLESIDLFVFNIFDIKAGKYLGYRDIQNFCNDHGLKTVPLEFEAQVYGIFDNTLETWLERARGKYKGTNVNREGIVVRTINKGVSFKVLNNDYLLKEED